MNSFRVIQINKTLIKLSILFCYIFSQSCSNSNIGQKLANSFDEPIQSSNKTPVKINNELKKTSKISKKVIQENYLQESKETDVKSLSRLKNKRVNSKSLKNKLQFKPQPYRIILILKETNPSDPTGDLTGILLNEGIKFEVERIERFEDRKTPKRLTSERNEF